MRVLFLAAALMLSTAVAAPAFAQDVSGARVIATRLNLRAQPDAGSEVLVTLPRNTVLVTLQQEGPWYQVSVLDGGRIGWVHGNHIEFVAMPDPDDAARAPRSGGWARQPMSVDVISFDCQKKIMGDGYQGCSVQIAVAIDVPSSYDDFSDDSVDIECESTVSYKTADGFMTQTDRASDYQTVWLSSGYGSTTAYLSHHFISIMNPVISARLTDASCRVR